MADGKPAHGSVPDVDDQQQRRRRSFNDRAGNYRLARPPYPDEVYQLLATRCGLRPASPFWR
jgi:hypothetical protein